MFCGISFIGLSIFLIWTDNTPGNWAIVGLSAVIGLVVSFIFRILFGWHISYNSEKETLEYGAFFLGLRFGWLKSKPIRNFGQIGLYTARQKGLRLPHYILYKEPPYCLTLWGKSSKAYYIAPLTSKEAWNIIRELRIINSGTMQVIDKTNQ